MTVELRCDNRGRHVDIAEPEPRVEASQSSGGLDDRRRLRAFDLGREVAPTVGVRHVLEHALRLRLPEGIRSSSGGDRSERLDQIGGLSLPRAREACGGGAQHQSGDALPVPPPGELRDGAAHRITDSDETVDLQKLGQCGDVVGTLLEPKWSAQRQAAAVAAVVRCEHPEVLSECLEGRTPVQSGSGGKAVQEHDDGGARGPGKVEHAESSAVGKIEEAFHNSALSQVGPRYVVRYSVLMVQKIGRCRFRELPDRYQRLFTGGVPTSDDVIVVREQYAFSDLGCLPLWYFFALTIAFGTTGFGLGYWQLLFAIPLLVLTAKFVRGVPDTIRLLRQRRTGGGLCGLVLDEEAVAVRVHDILRVAPCLYVPLDRLDDFWVGSEYNEGRGRNRSSTFMVRFRDDDEKKQVLKVSSTSTFEKSPRQLMALFLAQTAELPGVWTEPLTGAELTFEGEPSGGTGRLVRDVGGREPLSYPFR